MKRLLVLCLVGLMLSRAVAWADAPDVVESPVTADGMIGKLFRPAGLQKPVPAVLVLGGSEGGLAPEVTAEARLIAQHGMVALQLAYFGIGHLPNTLQLIPVEYFMAAIAWLQKQPGVDPGQIAILGTSIGGEVSLLVASRDADVHAVVAAVPSGIVWQGIGAWGMKNPASSFSWKGSALPFLPYRVRQPGATFDRYAGGLESLSQHRDAIMDLARINGPVMMVCGARDVVWPSCPLVAIAARQLRAAGFAHPVSVLAFPKAGHAVFGPPAAPGSTDFAALGSLGGTARANNAARTVDWPYFFAFLDKAFGEAPAAAPLRLASP